MRHLIYCEDCGVEFEKKTPSVLCEECLSKPKQKPKPVTKPKPAKKVTK